MFRIVALLAVVLVLAMGANASAQSCNIQPQVSQATSLNTLVAPPNQVSASLANAAAALAAAHHAAPAAMESKPAPKIAKGKAPARKFNEAKAAAFVQSGSAMPAAMQGGPVFVYTAPRPNSGRTVERSFQRVAQR